MAKAKAKERNVRDQSHDGLLERVIMGPKPLHCINYETNERYLAAVGDTVWLKPQHAKSKARYLQAPGVAKAQAAAKAAEEEAEEAEAVSEPVNVAIQADSEGGDSAES